MYILDSDHLSILQRQQGQEFENLARRCSALQPVDFFVTIVSFHEQFNGWTKYVARAKDSGALVRGVHGIGNGRRQLRTRPSASVQCCGGRCLR